MTSCVVPVYTVCSKYGIYVDVVFVMVGIYCSWVGVDLCFNILKFCMKFQIVLSKTIDILK